MLFEPTSDIPLSFLEQTSTLRTSAKIGTAASNAHVLARRRHGRGGRENDEREQNDFAQIAQDARMQEKESVELNRNMKATDEYAAASANQERLRQLGKASYDYKKQEKLVKDSITTRVENMPKRPSPNTHLSTFEKAFSTRTGTMANIKKVPNQDQQCAVCQFLVEMAEVDFMEFYHYVRSDCLCGY